jgi:hypothetical protein
VSVNNGKKILMHEWYRIYQFMNIVLYEDGWVKCMSNYASWRQNRSNIASCDGDGLFWVRRGFYQLPLQFFGIGWSFNAEATWKFLLIISRTHSQSIPYTDLYCRQLRWAAVYSLLWIADHQLDLDSLLGW